MKNVNIIFLCVGCIVGWGAFVLPQDLFLSRIGLSESIIGLFLGGVAICVIASNYAFLLTSLRKSGGEFYFTLEVLGRTHGFICGWFLSLAYLCIIPLNATALNIMCNSLGLSGYVLLYHINDTPIYLTDILVSAASVAIIGVINVLGIKIAFVLQKLLVFVLCGSVVVFFIMMSVDSVSQIHFSSYIHFESLNIHSILIVFSLAPWAYLGFECATQIIESIHYNKRIFNLFTYLSIWIGYILYVLLICIVALGVDAYHILSYPWAIYEGIYQSFGYAGVVCLCVGVLCAILSGINGFFITTSKLLESLSTHHFLPKSLLDINRFGISYRIVCIVGLLSCSMVIFGREALLYIVDMACVGIIVGFLYVSIVAFYVKRRELHSLSILNLVSILLSIVFLLLEFVPFSPAALKTPSIVALIVWSAVGVAVFYVLRQKEI
ncbi:APC family permease [Helicobacter typhlonius]|uniref:APC family permease n=1 Tax=Helicobacter typhlonius TaxID=76936 RepID=UPI002FDF961D